MKIVILDGYTIHQEDLNWSVLEELGDLTVYDRTPDELVVERVGDAEIIMTSKAIISEEVMDQCPNMKWIGVLATGYDMVDLDYATAKGIPVTNIPHYSTDSVAQFAFSLLLEICNQAKVHVDAIRDGAWKDAKDFTFTVTPQIELAGKTLGIIGFGNIGRKVATIAEAMGMKVLIATNHPALDFATDRIGFGSREEVLRQSDIISLHCPWTKENEGLINKETIGLMKDGVILINTARGALIQEEDLAEALKSGKVFAAGLDVLSEEPPTEDNPLLDLPNCYVTPHIAWITKEARIRLIDIAAANLQSFLEGGRLNCVNKPPAL